MRPSAYHELWSLAVELAPTTELGARFGPASTFDCSSAGLILRPDEGRSGNDCTPLNADTFAETGGDGVHYSFLPLPERTPDEWPVVMTVPMEANCNFIVGADFVEFLRLGCQYGYFAIERLAYDRDRTIAHIQSGAHAFADREDSLLAAIRERFGLRPWIDVRNRLDQLHARFHGLIRLPADSVDANG